MLAVMARKKKSKPNDSVQPPKPIPPCRHCKRRLANRHRGLCWTCYEDHAIRRRYPTQSIYGHRGLGTGTTDEELTAPERTVAEPGSSEKLAVLIERIKNQQQLWNNADADFGVGRSLD